MVMEKVRYFICLLGLLIVSSCQEENVIYQTAATADFSIGAESYELGEPIELSDLSVPAGENRIVSWLWEFGDEANSSSSEQAPHFTYIKGGSYTIKLTVTDNNGLKAFAQKDVVIIDPAKAINVMWQKPLLGAIENTVSPALSPDGNTVYMYADQSATDAYDVKLKAYDVNNGNLKWQFNVNDALAALNPGGGVRLVYCSPSVGNNGDVYLTVRDLKNAGAARKTFLLAVKSDGSLRWSYNFGIDANINYVTPAIDALGRIYIGHLTTSPFAIAVLNPEDGTLLKSIPLTVGVRSGLTLSKNGQIYFCSTGGNGLYGIPYDGTQGFNYNTDLASTGGAISMDSNGTIYTVAALTGGGGIVAVNPNGTQKWVYKTPGVIQYGGAVLGMDGTLYANGGKVVAGVPSAGVVALNQDGSLKWHFATNEDMNNCVPLVDNRGFIHALSDNAIYFILRPDGTLFSSSVLGVKTFSSPLMDAKGRIFVGIETSAGVSEMFCLSSGAKSYAASAWPMKGKNPQRTSLQN